MSGRSAHSSKEKKSKSSSTSVQTPSSSTSSQPTICDESELERQYQTYKKQFDEWTSKNKGVVSEQAYNNYVDQFKAWEKEIDRRRNLAKSHKSQQHHKSSSSADHAALASTSSSAASTNGAQIPFDPAAVMNIDPYQSMMMMTAMMMMPFMMMGGAPPNPTDAAAGVGTSTAAAALPAVPAATEEPETVSFTGKPVSYKDVRPKQPAPPPGYIPLPDLSKPPPIVTAPPHPAVPAAAAPYGKQIEMDRVRRGQRFNERYFIDDEPRPPPFRDQQPSRDYDDYWYRRCREGPPAPDPHPAWVHEPRPVPLIPEGYRPRSPPVILDRMFRGHGFEPMQRGAEPWNQSGMGAKDFSMRRHERRF